MPSPWETNMADRHPSFTATAPGRFLTRRLGLPQPAALRRRSAEHPSLTGSLIHLTAGKSPLGPAPVPARTGLPSGAVNGQVVRVCGQSLLGA